MSVFALICTRARVEDFIVASLMVSSVVSTLSFGPSLTRRGARRGAIKQNELEQKKKVLAERRNTLNIEHQGEDEGKSAHCYFFFFSPSLTLLCDRESQVQQTAAYPHLCSDAGDLFVNKQFSTFHSPGLALSHMAFLARGP